MSFSNRPNIVLIISDQQRADTMPGLALGSGRGAGFTPHLDWLAGRGTVFRRAYCATPMCSPARASLLSGLYPHSHGMVANHQERPVSRQMRLSPTIKILADYLKPADYACAYAGKWHLGTGSDRRGFDSLAARSGVHDTNREEDNEILQFTRKTGIGIGGKLNGLDSDSNRYKAKTKVGASLLPLAFHPSFRNACAAAGFVRSRQKRKNPFCLVYSCHEPHPPFISPRPYDSIINPAEIKLPENPVDASAGRLMAKRSMDWQLKSTARFHEDEFLSIRAAYLGAVAYVDHLVGIILEALIDTDQFEDTLFIFTSDHGEMLGNHGMIFKGSVLFEELMSIPLLVHPPGKWEKAGVCHSLVSHVDLLPTILHWCGLEAPSTLPGKDFRPLLEEKAKEVNKGIAFQYYASNWGERPVPLRGWLTDHWKYVEDTEGAAELYNLENDPQEMTNLISNPGYASTESGLRNELRSWQSATGDPWPHYPMPEKFVKMPPGGPWVSDSA